MLVFCHGGNKDSVVVCIFDKRDSLVCVLNNDNIVFTHSGLSFGEEAINCEYLCNVHPYKLMIRYKEHCFSTRIISIRSSFIPRDDKDHVLCRFFDNHLDLLFYVNSTLKYEYELLIDEINKVEMSQNINNENIPLLANTKWLHAITSDCINRLIFRADSTYEEDNCEWDLTFSGKYHISKDTIFLVEYGLVSELLGEHQIVNTAIYMYIYQGDSLKFISNQKIEDGKIKNTYYPEQPVYYKREQ
jgi:hypothetical protein